MSSLSESGPMALEDQYDASHYRINLHLVTARNALDTDAKFSHRVYRYRSKFYPCHRDASNQDAPPQINAHPSNNEAPIAL